MSDSDPDVDPAPEPDADATADADPDANFDPRRDLDLDALVPDLTGRTALVTGSAVRVGRALLLSLAAAGADVAVHYRTSADAAATTAARARELGVAATTVQADVTAPEAVDAMLARVEADLGGVDVLVNAVGPFADEHWAALDPETWRTVIETNLLGTYHCCRAAVPRMREQGWGRVVNVGFADAAHDRAVPSNFPYFVAKKGVLMFTRMLAGDTATDGITVNAVSPFAVENTVADVSAFPRGRPARFADVAAPVLFFCSEAADYVSGQNVAVDGGRLHEA